MSGKQFGLILKGKNKPVTTKRDIRKLNPLQNSDDELEKSDSDSAVDWVEASLKKSAGNAGQKAAQRNQIRKALEEDSSIFQYDEVYDDIKKDDNEKVKEKVDKKPKYMANLLKQSARRKLENERRTERKVQRERETEGDEFKDKEAFVTSSFLEKQEEIKKAEEELKREEMLENLCDVQKHKNFSVFYGNLLDQKMGKSSESAKDKQKKRSISETSDNENDNKEMKKISPDNEIPSESTDYKKSLNPDKSIDSLELDLDRNSKESSFKNRKSRRANYRKKESSEERHSRNRSDSEQRQYSKNQSDSEDEKIPVKKESSDSNDSKDEESVVKKKSSKDDSEDVITHTEKIRNIFAKRTVGSKFDDAVKRYFQRLAVS